MCKNLKEIPQLIK